MYYYHQDGLNNILAVTDASGNVKNTYAYDDFGEVICKNETVSNSILFTGELVDESGLTYLRARFYDPTLGRFLTRDTYAGNIENPRSLNLYTYCENDPVNFLDPLGEAKYGSSVKRNAATENDRKLQEEEDRLELEKVESAIEQAKFYLKFQGVNPSDSNYESLLISTAIKQYEMNEQAMNAVMGKVKAIIDLNNAGYNVLFVPYN